MECKSCGRINGKHFASCPENDIIWEQMSIDFGHPARKTDPDTSHTAADMINFRNKHFAVILYVLTEPMGKDGIARLTGLTGTQVDRRLHEMEKAGLIEPTGKKVLSDAGRPERQWRKKII